MRLRFFIYRATRILFGILLILNSIYNIIKYSGFLDRLDQYFNNTKVFDTVFLEAIAPLVPFEEFVIGMFLVMGIFIRRVLITTTLLFFFFALFLIDADYWDRAFVYLLFCMIAIVLLMKDRQDSNSRFFNKKSYVVI